MEKLFPLISIIGAKHNHFFPLSNSCSHAVRQCGSLSSRLITSRCVYVSAVAQAISWWHHFQVPQLEPPATSSQPVTPLEENGRRTDIVHYRAKTHCSIGYWQPEEELSLSSSVVIRLFNIKERKSVPQPRLASTKVDWSESFETSIGYEAGALETFDVLLDFMPA